MARPTDDDPKATAAPDRRSFFLLLLFSSSKEESRGGDRDTPPPCPGHFVLTCCSCPYLVWCVDGWDGSCSRGSLGWTNLHQQQHWLSRQRSRRIGGGRHRSSSSASHRRAVPCGAWRRQSTTNRQPTAVSIASHARGKELSCFICVWWRARRSHTVADGRVDG